MCAHMVAQQAGQHVGKAINRIDRHPLGVGHGGEGMKSAEYEAAAIHENQMRCVCHGWMTRVQEDADKKANMCWGYAAWACLSSMSATERGG
ncbi:hypothetical protein AA18895_0283 [Acetobacter ghanensis DSM 18895]|nr:hypothetical protein AA18895_0283 [Acetobacter ghanensis DSM 18895]